MDGAGVEEQWEASREALLLPLASYSPPFASLSPALPTALSLLLSPPSPSLSAYSSPLCCLSLSLASYSPPCLPLLPSLLSLLLLLPRLSALSTSGWVPKLTPPLASVFFGSAHAQSPVTSNFATPHPASPYHPPPRI